MYSMYVCVCMYVCMHVCVSPTPYIMGLYRKTFLQKKDDLTADVVKVRVRVCVCVCVCALYPYRVIFAT
jgi:hypothetical protein